LSTQKSKSCDSNLVINKTSNENPKLQSNYFEHKCMSNDTMEVDNYFAGVAIENRKKITFL